MKQKLLTLATLLLCAVSGAWADVDPTLDVEFTSSTKANWLKTYTPSGITLSGSGGFSSSSGYYYSGCSGNASNITDYYLGIAAPANKKISKVSIFVSPNNSNTVYPVFVGWAETATKTNVACYSAIAGTSTTNTKAGAEWITYDLGEVASDIIDLKIYRKVSAGNFYETGADKSIGNNKDLGAGVTLRIWAIKVWLEDTKVISTQTLGGVKKGSTKLTEGTDYTISSTTITLAEAYKAATAPTDVKLINQITYTDSSEEEQDVEVTLAKNGDYFEGSEFIGLTEYTVKVPVDVTPTLALSAASGTVSLKSYQVSGSITVTVTGSNLTGDTFTAPTVDGVTITPATATITEGSFSQEFTISTTATTAASTVIGFAHAGATTQNYTLTYSKTAQRSLAQADVTATTTWDWTKAGENVTLKDDGTTDPAKNDDFLLSNIAEITNDATFNSQALFVNLEHAKRDDQYMQGSSVTFNTTKPGTVQVWFSNTGKRDDTDGNRRYLYVNGVNSGVYTLNTTMTTNATPITVPSGKVVIDAYTGTDVATMLRISKIVFTANDAIEQDAIEVPCPGGLGTFYDGSHDLDFSSSSAQAYIVTAVTASAVTLTEVKKVPAGYGVIVKGASQGETVNVLTTTMTSDEVTAFEALGNKLSAGPTTVSSDGQYYALSKTDGKFHPLKKGVVIPAGKAYLPGSEVPAGANFLSLDFGEGSEATGIEMVESKKMVNNNVFYNLAGQQVAQPTKGLYIVNGKKVIIK